MYLTEHGAWLVPSSTMTSVHGTGKYSELYQRIKVNTNLPTNPTVTYSGDMPERYTTAIVTQLVGVTNHYLIGFKAHSMSWNLCLTLTR